MIRNIVSALAVSALALSTSAMAAGTPDSGVVNIAGSVGKKCNFMTDFATPNPIPLGELADTASGKLNAAKVEGQTATIAAWCNHASTLQVTANPIVAKDNTAPSTQFSDRVDYTATATFASVSANDTSTGAVAAGAGAPTPIFTDTVTVTLSGATAVNDGLLVAGDYEGFVTLTLTPQ